MATLQKMASIDAQMRLLVPKRVSPDDKLIEYDALLLDRFLDILEDLHGKELKDTVKIHDHHISLSIQEEFVLFLSSLQSDAWGPGDDVVHSS
jgi:hypothetical protein